MSPRAPPVSMNEAKVSVYASMIHARLETPAPSSRWIVGRATLTTRLSSMGMSRPNTMAASTHHFRRSPGSPSFGAAISPESTVLAMAASPHRMPHRQDLPHAVLLDLEADGFGGLRVGVVVDGQLLAAL